MTPESRKSVKELAKQAGYNSKQEFYASVKLNDLIPELQHLVSLPPSHLPCFVTSGS